MSKRELHAGLRLKMSVGRPGRGNLGKVENVNWTLAEFYDKLLTKFPVDSLTIAEYRKLSPDRQGDRKNVGFFVGGHCRGGIRKKLFIEERQILTLDIDVGSRELARRLEFSDPIGDIEYAVHSTRSHGGGKWKMHVAIPLAQPVGLDEWHAASRILAQMIDPRMQTVDPVSFVPTQVMFWGSTCKDVPPIAFRHEGVLLDVEALLDAWGPWQDIALLPRAETEAHLRDPSAVAADPTTKRGWVGAFCRTYNIHQAITEFSLPYEPSEWATTEPSRYSFTGGKGTNGLAIYDKGNKAQSNHGTDPAFGQNNAWDLCRIHLYGHLDTPGDAEKDPTRQKSYQALIKLLRDEHPEVSRELMESNYGTDEDGIADAMAEATPLSDALEAPRTAPAPDRSTSPKTAVEPPDTLEGEDGEGDWRDRLEITKDGNVRSILPNHVLIVQNAPSFRGVFAFNDFEQLTVLERQMKSKRLRINLIGDFTPGARLDDFDRIDARHILEAPRGPGMPGWGLKVNQTDLDQAIQAVARLNRFHPVREHLSGLEWDGTPRLETMLSTALGTPQDAYHAQVGRNTMVAAVARVFDPGCKWDFLPILEGPQGWFKSTFVHTLAPDPKWATESEGYFEDDKRFVESTRGKLIVELPELSQLTRADVRAVKNMLSRRVDRTRLAYRRDEQDFPRQCVMIGTTNEEHYLRDETGNRRFWPVRLLRPADLNWLAANRAQLWAEAYATYLEWRFHKPEGDLPLHLTGDAARLAEVAQAERMTQSPADGLAGEIAEWLDRPIVADAGAPEDETVREMVCGAEIAAQFFPNAPRDHRHVTLIGNAMRKVPGWAPAGREYLPGYGQQRVYRRTPVVNKGDDL